MPQINRKDLFVTLLILLFTAGFLSLLPAKLYTQDETQKSSKTYVGSETCLGCHADKDKSFLKTAHYKLFLSKTPSADTGCEACHGGGSLHIENPGQMIINFKDAKEGQKACLRCHSTGKTSNFLNSQHSKKDITCTKCHNPHKEAKTLLRDAQPSLCLNCHQNKITEIKLPSHHPIKEKKVVCADCHNPHQNSKQASKKLGDVCLNCHQEKAGPFLYEHRSVAENCLSCHTPHGSVNQNLLTLKMPFLCVQCHNPLPADHSVTSRSRDYKKCTRCHASIHGSNRDKKLRD